LDGIHSGARNREAIYDKMRSETVVHPIPQADE
jgi:hypothetical protein